MSDVVDINQVKEEKDWKSYCEHLFKSLQNSNAQLQAAQSEIVHLKQLLESLTPKFVAPSNETIICEIQIKRLHDESLTRPLTLEETKRLDLLIKNLYLARGQATEIVTNQNANPDKATDDELLKIVKGNFSEHNS